MMSQDKDPFEQASSIEEKDEQGGHDQISDAYERIEIEPIDDEVDSVLETEQPKATAEKPSNVKPVAAARKGFPVAGLLATTALILAIVSAGGVVYSLNSTGQLRDDVTVAFTDADDNIAALGNRQSETEVSISQLRETAGQNTIQIRQLDTDQLAIELASIKRDVDQYAASVSDSRMDSEETLQSLQSRVDDLEALTQSLKKTTARAASAPAPKRVVRARKPKPQILDSLNGSTVVSVDQWGYDSSVVLHDPSTGEFVSVAKGGVVNGWRYEGADPEAETAKFVQGGKTINVKIKG